MNSYLPWYRIVWNAPWALLACVFRAGFAFCVLMCSGPDRAVEAWKATQ